jgi:hypothetical protein
MANPQSAVIFSIFHISGHVDSPWLSYGPSIGKIAKESLFHFSHLSPIFSSPNLKMFFYLFKTSEANFIAWGIPGTSHYNNNSDPYSESFLKLLNKMRSLT